MTHNNDNLGFYAILGFGAGIYIFFKGFRQFRDYRLVADTPEMPIRSIPMGFVEIHGVAKGEHAVQSPVSHRPCLAYKVVIEQWKTDSQSRSASWHHHRTDVDGVNFYLTDAGGKVLVDPRKADLDLPQTARREAGSGGIASTGPGATEHELLQYVTQADAHWIGGLAARGLGSVGPLSDPAKEQKRQALMGAFQYAPGSPEFIRQMVTMMAPKMKQQIETMGPQTDPKKEQARQIAMQAFQHPVGSPEFLEGVRRAEEMAGEPGAARQLAAMMQANPQDPVGGLGMLHAASGRYRLTEYCLVPDGTYDVSGTCVENPNPRDEYDRNLITKGTNERVFLISSKTEKQVEAGLWKSALGKIFGGAALAIICLAILLAKLGLF
jgi:hypothetical protein